MFITKSVRGVKITKRFEKGYVITTMHGYNFSIDDYSGKKITATRLVAQGVDVCDAAYIIYFVENEWGDCDE